MKPLTSDDAQILQEIFTSRMRYYVVKWLAEDVSPGQIQQDLWRLATEYQFELKPEPESDPDLRNTAKRLLNLTRT